MRSLCLWVSSKVRLPSSFSPRTLFLQLPAYWFAAAVTSDLAAIPPPAGLGHLPAAVAGLLAIGAGVLALRRAHRSGLFAVLLAASACAIGLQTSLEEPAKAQCPASAPQFLPAQVHRFQGVVVRVHHREQEADTTLRVLDTPTEAPGAPPAGCVVSLRGPAAVVGDLVSVVATLHANRPPRNLSATIGRRAAFQPDYRGRIRTKRQWIVLKRNDFAAFMTRIREHVRASLRDTLSPRGASIARALVLGDGGAVTQLDRQRVRRAGVSHLLAVSGLHVAILAGSARWLLFQILACIPRIRERHDLHRWAAGLAAPLTFLIAEFAGGAPSAWRAATTAALHWVIVALGRRPVPMEVTACAALVLGLSAPSEIHNPSFVLSVVATTAIVSSRMPHPAHRNPSHAWTSRFVFQARRTFALSVRTCIATAPILYGWFGSVPLVSVVANLVLIPVASFAWIPLAFLHALLAALQVPGPPFVTGWAFDSMSTVILRLCAIFAKVDWGQSLPPPHAGQVIASAIGALALTAVRVNRWKWLSCALLLWGGSEWWLRAQRPPEDMLQVTFVDVGQGDAALLDLPNGESVLIDAGGWIRRAPGFPQKRRPHVDLGSQPNTGTRILLPILEARRRSGLVLAILSHGHPDHYGGMEGLFAAVHPQNFWGTQQQSVENPRGPAARLVSTLISRGTFFTPPAGLCGRPRWFGLVKFTVLAPCPRYDPGYGDNDNSMVVMVEYRQRRFLFSGDIERHGEASLLSQDPSALSADILKVPHHGSRTSSSWDFLKAVGPTVAIVSSGQGNPFGHPHPEVVERYAKQEIELRRIDQEGGIEVRTDGRRLWIRSYLHPTWREIVPTTKQPKPATTPTTRLRD